jgi:regulator of cell morphogenesis and NO signaling
MMESTMTLGELVADNPARSEAFEKFGMDYCCGGRVTLADTCAEKGVAVAEVLKALEESDRQTGRPEIDVRSLSLAELTRHIERAHHDYLRVALPRLSGLLEKVTAAHGGHVPYLAELSGAFPAFRAELEAHMEKEENVTFPAVRMGRFDEALLHETETLEEEHASAGAALESFRALTNDFAAPPQACPTFSALLEGLEALEQDMHRHVHLENSILFPRALSAGSQRA